MVERSSALISGEDRRLEGKGLLFESRRFHFFLLSRSLLGQIFKSIFGSVMYGEQVRRDGDDKIYGETVSKNKAKQSKNSNMNVCNKK